MDELLKKVKQSLSIVETATLKDEEIKMWICSAIADLKRQGIKVSVEISEVEDSENEENEEGIEDSLVIAAIVMFVKANFGNVDINEKKLAQSTYSSLCANLGLSEEYKEGDSNA